MRTASRLLEVSAPLTKPILRNLWRCENRSRAQQARCISRSSAEVTEESRVIFSGIQPTGVPHLGNYFGALQRWVSLQNESAPPTQCIFSIVDLHSLTSMTQTVEERRDSRRKTLAAFLAIGLDPQKCTLFFQSAVPAHSELHWILSCEASMGYLSRMTQWKEKLGTEQLEALLSPTGDPHMKQRMRLGLFTYPVLQAADVLVHRATHVPVGEDQSQHLEFARKIASQFNKTYGSGLKVLVEPKTLISPAKRVKALDDPSAKMSKSAHSRSRIELSDDPDTIRTKIRNAVTDSNRAVTYEPVDRPGISNLLEILHHLDPIGRPLERAPWELGDIKVLKEELSRTLIEHFEFFRKRYTEYLAPKNAEWLRSIADDGAKKASASAQITMSFVREAVGI